MILGHFDKNFKRVGTTIDAHTLMLIRGTILLILIFFPFYPLIFLWMYHSKEVEFEKWPTFAKTICWVILAIWVFLFIGILQSQINPGESVSPFDNLPSWSYRDSETGEWHKEYKGIDY